MKTEQEPCIFLLEHFMKACLRDVRIIPQKALGIARGGGAMGRNGPGQMTFSSPPLTQGCGNFKALLLWRARYPNVTML